MALINAAAFPSNILLYSITSYITQLWYKPLIVISDNEREICCGVTVDHLRCRTVSLSLIGSMGKSHLKKKNDGTTIMALRYMKHCCSRNNDFLNWRLFQYVVTFTSFEHYKTVIAFTTNIYEVFTKFCSARRMFSYELVITSPR